MVTVISAGVNEAKHSAEILLHQAPESVQLADLVDRLAKLHKCGKKLGEIATRPGQPAQGQLGTIEAEFALDQLEKTPAALVLRGRRQGRPVVSQRPGLSKNPRIAQAAPADSHSVGPGLLQKPQRVRGLPDSPAT